MATKIPEIAVKNPANKKRAILDTNIWRYVVDNKSNARLLKLAKYGPFEVQVAPAVLYEVLRMRNVPLRDSLVRLLTNPRFSRLMPEAYSESMEILREIERVRPNWLRRTPDLQFFNRLKLDWTRKTGGFWVRCAQDPAREVRLLTPTDAHMIGRAREETIDAREEMRGKGVSLMPSLDEVLGVYGEDTVEGWRVDSLKCLTYALSIRGHPYRDWIVPFVEIDNGLIYSRDWSEFWLHLADERALPKQWLRFAHSIAQRFRKVTAGSPGDAQLFTYFVETDVVITADKALVQILDQCRPYAPCKLPEGKVVPGNSEGVAVLLEMLDA